MSVLSVQSVSYSYKTKYQTVQAVKDVSCDLSAGTLYALVGKSGSGKTTLLSLLAGLDTPQSGDIMVNGQSLREIDVDIYRRKQASVIYQSYNLFPLMTVCENVMYPLKLLRHSDADAKKEAQIALEKAIKEYQGTVLMVTHDFYTVANCADRILLLENGTVREQSGRAYRKSIYKKYFESDIFETERIRVEKEVRIHALLRDGKWKEAKNVL